MSAAILLSWFRLSFTLQRIFVWTDMYLVLMQKFHGSLSQHESFTPRWLYISVALRLLLLFCDIVDIVIKSLLRCQTMDMFSHLYRSGTFAYSMLNTTVSVAQRLFTHLCFVHVNYCAWNRNISADADCCAVCQEIPPLMLCFTAALVLRCECSYTLLFNGRWYWYVPPI